LCIDNDPPAHGCWAVWGRPSSKVCCLQLLRVLAGRGHGVVEGRSPGGGARISGLRRIAQVAAVVRPAFTRLGRPGLMASSIAPSSTCSRMITPSFPGALVLLLDLHELSPVMPSSSMNATSTRGSIWGAHRRRSGAVRQPGAVHLWAWPCAGCCGTLRTLSCDRSSVRTDHWNGPCSLTA